ncbi:hypothetical protein [Bacillus sp. JJ722]|uniref:hypothetical protein n=1 Tax=Bacillus sp. JJ722 TaxID=3122973 RepID=UPI002FFFE65B
MTLLLALVGCSAKNETEETKPKETEQSQNETEFSSGLPEKISEGKAYFSVGRDWKESEHFTNGNTMLIVTPNLLGVTFDEDEKFYVNKPQKHIWYFWGGDEMFNGTLSVKAFHQDTSEKIELVKETPLGGSLNGANNHAPTTMEFTKKGMWALDAYISDKLFGSVFL